MDDYGNAPRRVLLINDKVLYVGDTMSDRQSNRLQTVDLTYEGLSVQLKMDE